MESKCLSSVAVAFLCALSICSSHPAYAAPTTNPCSLLTKAQVSAVLGMKVMAVLAPGECLWSAPNQPSSTPVKQVWLTISDQRTFGYAQAVGSMKGMPVSGICDDAFYAVTPGAPGLGASLYAKKGNSYIVVRVGGFSDQPKAMAEKTLAIQACSKL